MEGITKIFLTVCVCNITYGDEYFRTLSSHKAASYIIASRVHRPYPHEKSNMFVKCSLIIIDHNGIKL